MTGADAIAIIVLLIILVAVGVYLLHWLYRHSSKDEAFVRTGLGGEKVVMGGGAFVIPIIHDITRVNMNTVPLEIKRSGESSLITRNKIRVDLVGEFSVRVIPTTENVSLAARTLGERTAAAELMQGSRAGPLRRRDVDGRCRHDDGRNPCRAGRQFMRQVVRACGADAGLERARARERLADQPQPGRHLGLQPGQCLRCRRA